MWLTEKWHWQKHLINIDKSILLTLNITARQIGVAILNWLEECGISLEDVEILGADGTYVNTGYNVCYKYKCWNFGGKYAAALYIYIYQLQNRKGCKTDPSWSHRGGEIFFIFSKKLIFSFWWRHNDVIR